MNYAALLIAAVTLALSTPALGADVPAGKVVEWPGGTANIMTYGFDDPIGRVAADGSVTFNLPTPPETGQTFAQTFDRCRTSPLDVVNGEADVAPVMAYVLLDGKEVAMVAADSAEMANYQLSWGQTELVKGSHVRWLHVDGNASVTGRCVEEMVTVSGPAEFVNEFDLKVVAGWNLIRTTFLEIMQHEDGTAHETHSRHDALQAWPADAAWHLEQK